MLARTPPATLARTAPRRAVAPKAQAKARPPLEPQEQAVAMAQEALADCAMVLKAFSHEQVADLLKPTRGSAGQSFMRQVLTAGMVTALGFEPEIVGAAVNRSKEAIEHSCAVIAAIRQAWKGAGDHQHIRAMLAGVDLDLYLDQAKLTTPGDIEEWLEHAGELIEDAFAAFIFVAVRGRFYRRAIAKFKAEREKP